MKIEFYPQRDMTRKEIKAGHIWLYADVTCPYCGKEQPVSATNYLGGPCHRCGKMTGDYVPKPLIIDV